MLQKFGRKCLEGIILGVLIRGSSGENIEVVLLEESKILTGLGELTLLHTLTDIPVDEGTLGVHEVELGDKSLGEDARDGNVVSDHDDVTGRVGHVIIGSELGRLVVEADLETGWAPVYEGDLVVGLDPLGDLVGLLGSDISSVVEGDGHVFVLGDIEVLVFDKEGGRVEGVVGDVLNSDSLEVFEVLSGAEDRGDGGGHEVKSRERNQVGLEFVQVNVQLTIESKGGGL